MNHRSLVICCVFLFTALLQYAQEGQRTGLPVPDNPTQIQGAQTAPPNSQAQDSSASKVLTNDNTAAINEADDEIIWPPIDFGFGFELGFVSLPTDDGSQMIGWQRLVLNPELASGKFSMGLTIPVDYRFNAGSESTQFEVRPEDWIVNSRHSFADVYFEKINYIRYGERGSPFYASVESLDRSTFGNGFIMNEYDSSLFQPEQRITGAKLDMDGRLFNIPVIGLESTLSNFARWDLGGVRAYAKPAIGDEHSVYKDAQIGVTVVTDANPHGYNTDTSIKSNGAKDRVVIYGLDFKMPIVSSKNFSLAFIGDLASQNNHLGSQVGVTGKTLEIFDYKTALRILGPNYLPDYFDHSYDLYREDKFSVYNDTTRTSPYDAWLIQLGVNVIRDLVLFSVELDEPFYTPDLPPGYDSPNIRARLKIKEGLFGGLSASAWYEKTDIGTWADLISPEKANIGAQIGYKIGPATIALVYAVRYDPYTYHFDSNGTPQKWMVTSKLQTTISVVGGGKK